MRLMYPKEKGPLTDIPASGPAPVLLRPHELRKIVPDWKRLTAHIEAHKETKEKLGKSAMPVLCAVLPRTGATFSPCAVLPSSLRMDVPAQQVGCAKCMHGLWLLRLMASSLTSLCRQGRN